MKSRHPSLLAQAILFAHRGAKAHAKENTIDSFRLAYEMGATGLETDVWITRDGVPVLDHDGVFGSVVRRKPIAKFDRADLPPHVATLGELYAAVGTDIPISVDIMDPNAFGPTIEVSRAAGGEDNLWLCHSNVDLLVEQRTRTSAKLICSTRLSKIEGIERQAQILSAGDIDGLNMHHSDWSPGAVATLHRFGRLALAWDTQFERQIAKMIDCGIDGIFSDHVDRMVATAAEFTSDV